MGNRKNEIDNEISRRVSRPAELGRVGQFIAARVVDTRPYSSATHAHSDGEFVDGPLAGRTVNVKWYLKRERVVDLTPAQHAGELSQVIRETRVEAVVTFNKGIFNLVATDPVDRYEDRLVQGGLVRSRIAGTDQMVPIFLTFPTAGDITHNTGSCAGPAWRRSGPPFLVD